MLKDWKKIPEQKFLQERFIYDPETGYLARRTKARSGKNRNVGDRVGCIGKRNNYLNVKLDGEVYMGHRLIWSYVYGNKEINSDFEIDHINQIRYDNRLCNLRLVSRTINLRNKKLYTKNKTGFSSVYKVGKKWKAGIKLRINGKSCNKHLGTFDSVEEAILKRKEAETIYWK